MITLGKDGSRTGRVVFVSTVVYQSTMEADRVLIALYKLKKCWRVFEII